MTHWLVIPIKPFEYGKSRLAGVLHPEARVSLNRRLLQHTIEAILKSDWKNVAVISKEKEALGIANQAGFRFIKETPPFGLNRAMKHMVNLLMQEDAGSLTLIPSDLPLLEATHLQQLFEIRCHTSGMIVIPDHRHMGTNVLSLLPPDLIPFHFGKNSFMKHQLFASDSHSKITVIEEIKLMYDLDTKEDIDFLVKNYPDQIQEFPELFAMKD